ncbi:MAG: FAD-binding oxidoreductase [Rubellimicrobium sp.]|nr:FAD-binding oxidoreductase [Rubellimicrobium sp.]
MATADTVARLRSTLGAGGVLTGADAGPFSHDWPHEIAWTPLCVARPADRDGVVEVLRIAREDRVPVVPVGGNTGLSGGTKGEGAIMLSLERMNRIRDIRHDARTMTVEAGVVLQTIREAAAAHDLVFPLTFGAQGSARIGGCLATNAGGSNVVRYGSARALCLGIEVVLASGEVLDLMSSVRKDNTGYDLRDLFIGSEGTLGVITAAVLRLFPRPETYATAMVAAPDLAAALTILNRLQSGTGGQVEAFEYMPRNYIEAWKAHRPETGEPFAQPYDVNLLVEIGASAGADADARLEDLLAAMMDEGLVLDATFARSEAQRRAMWARREAAGELTVLRPHVLLNDVSLPLENVAGFVARILPALREIDPGVDDFLMSHLGDGNVHYNIWPSRGDPALHERLRARMEDLVAEMGGSFSAEHGIGVSKLGAMARRKDQVALDVMRRIRAALDPDGLLNPGKTVPEA